MSRADLALRSRPTAVLSALEQTGGAGVCDARRLSDALHETASGKSESPQQRMSHF